MNGAIHIRKKMVHTPKTQNEKSQGGVDNKNSFTYSWLLLVFILQFILLTLKLAALIHF